jgi:hypothetical protein
MSGSQVFSGGQMKNAGNSYFQEVTIFMSMFFRMENNPVESFFRVEIPNCLFLCILLLYVLFSLDIASTSMILSLGGYEVNAVMVPVAGSYFFHLLVKGFVLVIVGSTALWSEGKIPGSGLMMLLVIIVWYSLVIVNNTSVLISLCRVATSCPPAIPVLQG